MTFEEWWEYKFEAPAFGLTIDDMRKAYEAGFEAGWDVHDEVYATQAAANWGR